MGRTLVPSLAAAAAILMAAAVTGCQSAPGSTVDGRSTVDGAAGGTVTQLVAQLTSPTDVALRWTGADAGVAGHTVEYANVANAQFVVLQFVAPDVATFTHPDLMPETTFYYRVRPYYGPASAEVRVDLPPGEYDDNAHENDPNWAAPSTRPEPAAARQSIRAGTAAGVGGAAGVASAGAPSGLRATIRDANGIAFTWTDHATDEDGYLLEVKPAGAADFGVAAVLDADVNTYGLVTLPGEKHAAYRVRAFYFGPSSNVVHETTGKDASG